MYICFSKTDKACEYGRKGLVDDFLNESDHAFQSRLGYSSAIWHAANNGHSKIVEKILKMNNIMEIIDNPAPDGTTPLMMAIAKRHHDTVRHFETILGRSKIVSESAKFGQIYDKDNKNTIKELHSETMNNVESEA